MWPNAACGALRGKHTISDGDDGNPPKPKGNVVIQIVCDCKSSPTLQRFCCAVVDPAKPSEPAYNVSNGGECREVCDRHCPGKCREGVPKIIITFVVTSAADSMAQVTLTRRLLCSWPAASYGGHFVARDLDATSCLRLTMYRTA